MRKHNILWFLDDFTEQDETNITLLSCGCSTMFLLVLWIFIFGLKSLLIIFGIAIVGCLLLILFKN